MRLCEVEDMPKWVVHEDLGEICNIPRSLMRSINKFLDIGLDHDRGRLIVYGRWDPDELYSIAKQVYEKWGLEGVKAMIHHHLMDYTCSLLTKLKYGALIKYIVKEVKRNRFARIYEDINSGQLYTSPLVKGTLRTIELRREEAIEFIAERITSKVDEVLNYIERDFAKLHDPISKHLHNLAKNMRNCIRTSAHKLIHTYISALLIEARESPCKSFREKPQRSSLRNF